jgi:hypothetical protein
MVNIHSTFSIVCFLLSFASRSAAAVVNTGVTVQLNDISYYAPPHVVGKLVHSLSMEPGEFKAITVITTKNSSFGTAQLFALRSNFSAVDDVWQDGFLDDLHIQYTGNGTFGTKSNDLSAFTVTTRNQSAAIPTGPYFMSASGELYEAHRLYSDSIGAFTESVTQNPQGTFSVLPAGVSGQNLAVAVPSRLYYTKTSEKPLAGIRLGVKDLYDIANLKTSNGNRAWYHLYPPAATTGTAIQNLIDAGAIVVGKLKTSQFANGERATADWVDYHEPFNPRGDGMQDTTGSSAGSGASVGAYDWLDLTVGSDTGGSIREPAQVQGVFGNRPTHGLVSLDHVMPMAPELDSSGLLARDPLLLKQACKALYKQNITMSTSYPAHILALGFPRLPRTDGEKLLNDFLKSVGQFLNASTTVLNMQQSWSRTSGISTPLETYLNLTYPVLISQNQIKNVRDPFYADYAAKHDGRLPFVDPVPLARWAYGASTNATIASEVAKKTVFMNWFEKEILRPDATTCSDKLLLYVGSNVVQTYRNAYPQPPTPPFGYTAATISIFSGAPDIVVPSK